MSLVDIQADHALASIVSAALEPGSGKDGRALLIRLDLRYYNYNLHMDEGGKLTPRAEDEEDIEDYARTSTLLYFLVYRPTNYTQVYVASNLVHFQPPKPEEYALQSDHDSCWRSDGFREINVIANGLRDQVTLKDSPEYEVKTSETRHSAFLHTEKVTVETERVPGVNFGPGRKRVVSIKRGWPE